MEKGWACEIMWVWASRRSLSWVAREGAPPQGDQPVAPTGEGAEGEGMEGPGRLRSKTATPAPMHVASATALRQPCASERMWRRREEISVWGSLDHQKCPTIRRYGGVDSIPSLGGMSSPRATTAESLGTMALLSSMTPCSWALPDGARMMRRVSGARTWQGPLERASQFLSGNLP